MNASASQPNCIYAPVRTDREGSRTHLSNMRLVPRCLTRPPGPHITGKHWCEYMQSLINTWAHTHVTVQRIRTRLSSAPSLWASSESIMSTRRAAEQRGTSCVRIQVVLSSAISWGESGMLLHCCCRSIVCFLLSRFCIYAYSMCVVRVCVGRKRTNWTSANVAWRHMLVGILIGLATLISM